MDKISVSDQTRHVVAHILHDAEANVEGQISDYDPERLREAENAGLIILAEYSDGSRKIVKAKDVREPEPVVNGVTLVQPAYVDDRMAAVIDVFDALATEAPAPMLLSSEAAPADAPALAFAGALAALKELVLGGEVAK